MTIKILLERFYEIANGGEGDLAEIFTKDFELGIAPGFPYGGEYFGMDGVAEFFGAYKKHFEIWTVHIDRFLPIGTDQMIATGSYSAKTSNGGVVFEMETAHLWKAKNGKLKSLKQYCDTAVLSQAMSHKVPIRAS